MVWGLGVGYVISGNYFGWNLGLERGGSLGLAVATALAIVLYITFTYSYAELACAIPKAGGAFDYASRSLGPTWGFIAGTAQIIEFLFAPPAIAFGLGTYLHLFFPAVSAITFSLAAYVLFTALNISGIKAAATFELVVTVVAVTGLLLFSAALLPAMKSDHLMRNALPHGWAGAFAAIPFAIWFFLGIEGVANLAEETIDPSRTMARGFLGALFTLILVCMLTFASSVGTAGWEKVVFNPDGGLSDAPLPMAMESALGRGHLAYRILVFAGLFGLVASLNGLMLAAGRATCEFGKVTLGDQYLGKINKVFQTPANALLFNMALGMIALLTGKTGEVITISVFGALTLYIISMVVMIRLRFKEPELHRPFRAPAFPWFPLAALLISLVALVSMLVYNLQLGLWYALIIFAAYGIFRAGKLWRK